MNLPARFRRSLFPLSVCVCASLFTPGPAQSQVENRVVMAQVTPPSQTPPPQTTPSQTTPSQTQAPAGTQTAPPGQIAAPARSKPAQQEAFYVMGLSIRTTNSVEMTGQGAIPGVWQKFMQGDVASTIPDKVGNDLYVVYSDYESDQNGSYNYLLGARVSSIDHLRPGMVAKQVPAGLYVVVPSEKGPVAKVIPEVWMKIWSMTPEQLGGKRAFTDYEVYNLQSLDPQNMQVDVHIGLR